METIIDKQHHQSWEDTNLEESNELKDLPRTLKPQQIWPSESSSDVVLDLDSNTDTESDQNDSSEPGGYESSEYETTGGGNNWEIEMLAAQIRERRSASLDHNVNRPIKRILNRTGSVDHKKE